MIPAGLLDEICEIRAFVSTKRQYEASADKANLEGLPFIGLVIELEHELVKERGSE